MDFSNYLGKDIPKLGFGLMRLPRNAEKNIDIPVVKEMVDLFLESGFTYFDTAYMYEGSEEAAKEALVKRHPRESYQIASKLPAWPAKSREEAESMFNVSLERLGIDYFDYYLIHNIGAPRTQYVDRYGIWDYVAKRKEEGFIKHLGFSFHDSAEVLDQVLTEHPEMEFVQLQINYADWETNAIQSRKCYEVALKHNMPVIIMEPVKGSKLAQLPERALSVIKEADPDLSPAALALRFAGGFDGIITVLSGMSNMQQLRENIATFSDFKPLTDSERVLLNKVVEEIEKVPTIPCTSCGYCLDTCPEDIAIENIFKVMNDMTLYGKSPGIRFSYFFETEHQNKKGASACIQCGLCEGSCPQSIAIIEELKKAVELFEQPAKK